MKKELGFEGKVLFPEHHESHAASAFFASPFQESSILTIDGVGEWTTSSYSIRRDNRVSILADIKFPHSLGLLYSAFSYVSELWAFLKTRKMWWLLPIIIFLVVLGGLIILTQGSALAPFIYSIF